LFAAITCLLISTPVICLQPKYFAVSRSSPPPAPMQRMLLASCTIRCTVPAGRILEHLELLALGVDLGLARRPERRPE
jgi:hypothetical protein